MPRDEERSVGIYRPAEPIESMFRSGAFVGEHVSPVDEVQVQPNGVDITVDHVATIDGTGQIAIGDKKIAERERLEPIDGWYDLAPGGYVVRYGEQVRIPSDHVGFILPRSSLLRNGATLHTAVWDTGYEGRGAGLLSVTAPLEIEAGARIGQFVLARAEHAGDYDGSYQGEGL